MYINYNISVYLQTVKSYYTQKQAKPIKRNKEWTKRDLTT